MLQNTAYRPNVARAAWSGGLAVAMTASVLVVGSMLPTAVADHGEDPLFVDDNLTTCQDIADLPEAPPHGPFDPVTEDNNQVSDGVYEFDEATVEITDGGLFIDVVAEPGFEITAVSVKAGPTTNVYFDGPFLDMRAPDNPGGQQPTISHYTVCVTETNGNGGGNGNGNGGGYGGTPPTTPPTHPGDGTGVGGAFAPLSHLLAVILRLVGVLG